MKHASEDVRYLVNRGYSKESSVRFISDHYHLPESERFIVTRAIVAKELVSVRRSKAVPFEAMKEKDVFIDGHNVLITVESLLACFPVYLCDDGFLRDTQGKFRNYRSSEFTVPALEEIIDLMVSASPASVELFLDQQLSMSGRLAALIREMMAERGLMGTAKTAKDVDHQLKSARGIVATSDGYVIDAVSKVFDIPNEIAKIKRIAPEIL